MKRIILSTLIALSLNITQAQEDMSAEQMDALQAVAEELHPTNENQRKSWIKMQKNAFDSIRFANYALSKAELDSIKADAEKKYPNDYIEQEAHIRSQANTMINLSHMSRGIDPTEFLTIKNLAAKDSNGDPTEYMNLIQQHLEYKERLKNMPLPDGIDEVDFKILQRVIEKNFQYNYIKQYEEIQKRVDMLASISGAENKADKKDPNAYNTISTQLLKNHSIKTGDLSNPKLAIAVNFKEKNGFFCPLSAYSNDFELMTDIGDIIKIEQIHVSKDVPIMFVEIRRFPSGIEAINLDKFEDVKTKLSKPITLAGYSTASKAYISRVSINAIRDNQYLLSNKTTSGVIDGAMLLDYENEMLISFLLKSDINDYEIPDFEEKTKATTALNKLRMSSSNKYKQNVAFPVLESLENFELLEPDRMKMQMEFLKKLKDDNEDAVRLYTTSSLSALSSSKKYGSIVRESQDVFRERLGNDKFDSEARILMDKLILQLKSGYKANIDYTLFYVNLRDEILFQTELRNALVDYYEYVVEEDISAILPRDIQSARSEPIQKKTGNNSGNNNYKGKKGKKNSSSRNSVLDSSSLKSTPLFQ